MHCPKVRCVRVVLLCIRTTLPKRKDLLSGSASGLDSGALRGLRGSWVASRHARTPSTWHGTGTSALQRVWGKGGVTHPPAAHAFVVVGALYLTPPPLDRPFSAPRRTAPFASTANTHMCTVSICGVPATVTARRGGCEVPPSHACGGSSVWPPRLGELRSIICTEMRAGCLRTSSTQVSAGGRYTDDRMSGHPCDRSDAHLCPAPRLNRQIHPHAPPICPLLRPAGALRTRMGKYRIATVSW